MYRSSQTAQELIEELSAEMDVWEAFPPEWYLRFINALEQTLYSHSLLFPERVTLMPERSREKMGSVPLRSAVRNDFPREEDILRVYADSNRELSRMSPDLAPLFPCTYFVAGEGENAALFFRPACTAKLTVYYRMRPAEKNLSNYQTEHLAIPDEYLELLKEKLRGEAFLAVGEPEEAKNHLGAYNAYLSSFLLWAKDQNHRIGGVGRGE